jgi:5-deoxy-glucuronate isomerase
MKTQSSMRYTSENLLVEANRPEDPSTSALLNRVTAEQAGWELLNFELRQIAQGESWGRPTEEGELGLVILGGACAVKSNRGEWSRIGGRPHVFGGMGSALYLPRHSEFELTALTPDFEVAACWVPSDQDHPAKLVTPQDSAIEIRGGHNATRQINSIFPPGFDCHRLVCVEVYTPGGNWSSYPPHKHDTHREDNKGNLLEADLEEIYFYKFQRPSGFAMQRVYNDDRTLDAAMVAYTNDIVLVPYGYHPVSAAYGCDCYYLNFLAGSAQSLANQDDPDLAWIQETWTGLDPRVPLVHRGMA